MSGAEPKGGEAGARPEKKPVKGRIAWLSSTRDISRASFRYRELYPAFALSQEGWECDLYTAYAPLHDRIQNYDALVIVKRLDVASVKTVAEAIDAGVPVLVDLCDDILSRDNRMQDREQYRMVFRAIQPHVSRLVTTGPYLARRFSTFHGVDESRIRIAPDCVETPALQEAAQQFLTPEPPPVHQPPSHRIAYRIARAGYRTARYFWHWLRYPRRSFERLTASPSEKIYGRAQPTLWQPDTPAGAEDADDSEDNGVMSPEELERQIRKLGKKSVVWFGNHGGPQSDFGMLTLLRVAKQLRAAHARTPFRLAIVSNDLGKYKNFFPALGVPTRYFEWDATVQARVLERADVFLMPAGEDAYSLSKSANRAALALRSGTPVVAQRLESLEPLRDCISIDDIEEGLVRYLSDPEAAKADLARADELIEELWGFEALKKTWAGILEEVIAEGPAGAPSKDIANPKLLVLIDLVQDAEIALPVIDEARRRGIEVAVILGDAAVKQSKRVVSAMIERGIAPTFFRQADTKELDFRWLRSADALFCAAESTAAAHRAASYLTGVAKRAGVPTYTMQHGVECVGLNFDDPDYPGAEITADTVFVWGEPASPAGAAVADLHARCVPVGRVTGAPEAGGERPPAPEGRPLVGVFENLHWRRYSDDTRRTFMATLDEMARKRPDVTFLVKPHPAGRWILDQAETARLPDNVIVANPLEAEWEDWSVAGLAWWLDAAITTPSTAALDAAEAGAPVAVFAPKEADAGAYSALTRVTDAASALAFLDGALGDAEPHRAQARAFADSLRIQGDAAARVIDVIFPDSRPAAAPAPAPQPDAVTA